MPVFPYMWNHQHFFSINITMYLILPELIEILHKIVFIDLFISTYSKHTILQLLRSKKGSKENKTIIALFSPFLVWYR